MERNKVRAILKPNAYKAQRQFGLTEKLFGYDYSPMIAYGVDKGSHIAYTEATGPYDLENKITEIKKIVIA